MKNNHIIRACNILLLGTLYLSCNAPAQEPVIPYQKTVSIEIDGDISDWAGLNQTFTVEEFQAPWPQGNAGKTLFKAVSDGIWFYFYFQAEDDTPALADYMQETDVARGDRVELFVAGDPELKHYFCAELAPNGHVLDYQARYYRKFDNDWDMPQLQIATQYIPGGYRVEGKLPIAFLKALDPNASEHACTIWLGLYRADYFSPDAPSDQINWISWIDPDVEEPDFHLPGSFKKIRIEY